MNICEHLSNTARIFPEQTALIFEGRSWSYHELEQISRQAAHHLRRLGTERGDRIAIMLPNTPGFIVWYFATLRIGAIAVSVSTRLTPKEAGFIINDCDAALLIAESQVLTDFNDPVQSCRPLAVTESGALCDGELFEADSRADSFASELVEDMHTDEPAVILYTSGTTGFAKGATLSHENVRSTVHTFNHLCGMTPEDRILLSVPLFHCYGQNALLNSGFNVGATIVLQRRFDLAESKELIHGHGVTQLFGVPTTFQLLHDYCDAADLESVRYCFSAAAPLPIQVSDRWRTKFQMPIYEGYGLTETAPFASYNHRLKYVPGSIGTPVDLVEMKIVDTETGQTCEPGQLGEIAIRGPNVMLGYWNRDEDTNQAIRDGWFYSGDIGRQDEQGYFYIVDRVKDMISIGGMKVFPAEVERVLQEHSLIIDAAVVGVPDELFGEKSIAFLVVDEQLDDREACLDSVHLHCQGQLASYKLPKAYQFIDELPRNPAGKVLKRELRQIPIAEESLLRDSGQESFAPKCQASEETCSAPVPSEVHVAVPVAPASVTKFDEGGDNARVDAPAQSDFLNELQGMHPTTRLSRIERLLIEEMEQLLDGDCELDRTTSFVDSGLDSIAIVELRDKLQLHLGPDLELPATLVFEHPRICDLAEFLLIAIPFEPGGSPAAQTMTRLPESSAPPVPHTPTNESAGMCEADVESMSESQVLDELLREIED